MLDKNSHSPSKHVAISQLSPKHVAVSARTFVLNKKYESYTDEHYEYFVVNQEIPENEKGPGLIFKIEHVKKNKRVPSVENANQMID